MKCLVMLKFHGNVRLVVTVHDCCRLQTCTQCLAVAMNMHGACLSYVNVSCHNVLYVCECVMSQCILFMVLWRVLGSFSSF